MPSPTQISGYAREQAARGYLERRGLTLLDHQFHCRYGEIDLVMKENESIVFIEVRLRTHPGFADGITSVTQKKQAKIVKSAIVYLQAHPQWHNHDTRFDIVSFDGSDKISWLRNAFSIDCLGHEGDSLF
jgi:putative endonuclease